MVVLICLWLWGLSRTHSSCGILVLCWLQYTHTLCQPTRRILPLIQSLYNNSSSLLNGDGRGGIGCTHKLFSKNNQSQAKVFIAVNLRCSFALCSPVHLFHFVNLLLQTWSSFLSGGCKLGLPSSFFQTRGLMSVGTGKFALTFMMLAQSEVSRVACRPQ